MLCLILYQHPSCFTLKPQMSQWFLSYCHETSTTSECRTRTLASTNQELQTCRVVWGGVYGGGHGCPSQPQTTIKQIGQHPLEATISLDVNSSGFQSDCVRSLKLQQHRHTFFSCLPKPPLWQDAFPMATHNNQSTMCTCNTRPCDVTSCQEGCE